MGLVPVDVVLLVDGVNCQNHLSYVELGHVFRQPVLKLTEEGQQVSTYVVVHHQVLKKTKKDRAAASAHRRATGAGVTQSSHQEVVVLEGVVESCDPLTVSSDQDVSLLSETGRLQWTDVRSSLEHRMISTCWLSYTDLSSLQHLPLVENLHGINSLCVLHLHHGNLTERMHFTGWYRNSQEAPQNTHTYVHTHRTLISPMLSCDSVATESIKAQTQPKQLRDDWLKKQLKVMKSREGWTFVTSARVAH